MVKWNRRIDQLKWGTRKMTTDETRTWTLVRTLGPSAVGAGLFLAFAPVHLLVSEDISVAIAALTLALIGGAYIGFGASDGATRIFWMELGVAIFYAIMALAGLLWSPLALPLGLAAHAVWDLLHHNGAFGAPVPKWYIPFCVVFDLLAAAFFLVLYLE